MEPRPCEQFDLADADRVDALIAEKCGLAALVTMMRKSPYYRGAALITGSCDTCQLGLISQQSGLELRRSGGDVEQSFSNEELWGE